MKMYNVPVVFTPDENFIVQTSVAILSMLLSKKEKTQYVFHIVVSEKFDKEKFEYLDRIKNICEDFYYEVHYFNSVMFDKQKISTRHLTSSAYYRLALANIIDDDICMYHDGDILVYDDLSEMFNVEMDDFYVAGVKAILKHQNTKENSDTITKWKFPAFDNYIFSGDLVFNLKKIRADDMVSKFVEYACKGYPSEDQDVINMCCYGRICFLPLRYCMLNRWVNGKPFEQLQNIVYSEQEINDAQNHPAIIHFAGADTKPWTNVRAVYSDEWWKLARRILTSKEYNEWRKKAEFLTRERDWDVFLKKIDIKKEIVIFGFSKIAQELCDKLQDYYYNVVCFVDNDKSKQGNIYNEKRVLDVESALKEYQNAYYVISSQNYRNQIREQLFSLSVTDDHIIDYFHKSYIYFQTLDSKYANIEEMYDMRV